MESATLVNMKVKHKIFGEGRITEVLNNQLTIQFETKTSKFIYPDCFEKFITAEDISIQSDILNEIQMNKSNGEKRRMEIKNEQGDQKDFAAAIKTCRDIEYGFRSDYNVRYLVKQPILTYQQVEEQFGIKISGFGRGINRTPTSVVLISSIDKKKSGFVYHDHWTNDGDYIYSGEGKTGNQTMTSGNKAVTTAKNDGKEIHLFVKFSPQEYYYQGIFTLVDYSYVNDNDEAGNVRKEYKFRLRKLPVVT